MAFNKKDRDVYIKVYEPKDTFHSNQTRKCLVQSQAGHNYIMAMVHVNSSVILNEQMKTQSATEMIETYLALLKRLHRAGLAPKKHKFDN